MSSEQFTGVIAADPNGNPVIAVPFDPDHAWGAKAEPPPSAAPSTAGASAGGFSQTAASGIDATTRRPDVRAARIAEVVDLLAAGVKERPRPRS